MPTEEKFSCYHNYLGSSNWIGLTTVLQGTREQQDWECKNLHNLHERQFANMGEWVGKVTVPSTLTWLKHSWFHNTHNNIVHVQNSIDQDYRPRCTFMYSCKNCFIIATWLVSYFTASLQWCDWLATMCEKAALIGLFFVAATLYVGLFFVA